MKRELLKFLCGFLAGAGVVHANIGFGIAMGMFNEPHYLGRTWSATALWVGAAVYLLELNNPALNKTERVVVEK